MFFYIHGVRIEPDIILKRLKYLSSVSRHIDSYVMYIVGT